MQDFQVNSPDYPDDQHTVRVVADISRFHARQTPNNTAMIFEDRHTTYMQLDIYTSQVANGLISENIAIQKRVAWLDRNSDYFFEALLGCAKASLVMCPLNWRLAAPEVENIINDAEAEILFVGPDFFEVVEKIKGNIPGVKKIVAISGDHPEWELYENWRNNQSHEDPNLSIAGQDIVIQMYTSGTTGQPKGVLISNAALLASSVDDRDDIDWNVWCTDDVSLLCMPCFHIGGLRWGLMGLIPGCTTIILADFDPRAVLKSIRDYAVTKIFLVPAAIRVILQLQESQETDYSSIRHIVYGASPIPLDLLKQALTVFKCGFVQLYGMTETTAQATYLPPKDHESLNHERLRSAGKALPLIKVRIEDQEGNTLPPGQIGEICINSPANMSGYWKLPGETDQVIRKGWVHTGDAGYMDEDGYVYIHDRIKDMIVSGGENIYPADVENAVFGHPAVADVAVIGVPDEQWGEAVKAMVVLKDGASASANSIIAFAKERIAAYKVPKTVDFVEQLPRNAAGKLLKKDLRMRYWKGQNRLVH